MFPLINTAHAASSNAQIAAQCFVNKINDAILFPLITLMMALAFLFFLYGAFEYVKNANNEPAREAGRNHLFYGVIGMLVMLSAMAILSMAAGTFGIDITKIECSDVSANNKPEFSSDKTTQFGNFVSKDADPVALPAPVSDRAPQISNPSDLFVPDVDTLPDIDNSTFNNNSAKYPVLETWTDGTKVISCNNEVGCAGAKNECEHTYFGLYTGAGVPGENIVCKKP